MSDLLVEKEEKVSHREQDMKVEAVIEEEIDKEDGNKERV